MDDVLYESCLRYFTSLSHYGYRNGEEVKKLLLYVFIHELVNTTSIVTSCLVPYPKYCENPMYLHLGDLAELSKRVDELQTELDQIEDMSDPDSPLGLVKRVEDLENQDYILEGDAPTI